jgi:hypothetical protein
MGTDHSAHATPEQPGTDAGRCNDGVDYLVCSAFADAADEEDRRRESRRIEAELDAQEAVLSDWDYHMTEAYGRYWFDDDDLPPDASAAYRERIDAVRDGVDAAGLRAMMARHFPPESLSGGETDDTAAAVASREVDRLTAERHRAGAELDAPFPHEDALTAARARSEQLARELQQPTDADHPADRWTDLTRAVHPGLPHSADWPALAAALDRADAAGYDVATQLPRLAAQVPLDHRHPARDLHYRLVADCDAARTPTPPGARAGPDTTAHPEPEPPPAPDTAPRRTRHR